MVSTYASYRFYSQDLSKALKRTAAEPQVAHEAAYYQANIGKVKSVDDFLGNRRLFAYAMKAFGLEDMTYARAFMRKVLESDLTDSRSFANKLADTRYREFAAAFNFQADGSVASGADIQYDDQEGQTAFLYTQRQTAAATATAVETAYYKNHVDAVTSVDDLLHDNRLYSYALKAVGLDPTMVSRTAIRDALTSDLADPASAANRLGGDFLELAKSFNFATDGTVAAGNAQSTTQKTDTVRLYGLREDAGLSDAQARLRTLNYQANIDKITSVKQFVKNTTLYEYALTAYGIDPDSVSAATITKVLESDVSDPTSYVNRLGDERFKALASAFNFAADGSVTTRRLVQSISSASQTVVLYNSRIADDTVSQRAAAKETAYYKETIGNITSLDELMEDKRLVTYVLKAYGLADAKLSEKTLRAVLVSDISDPKSYANTQDSRYRDLAAAFNFDRDGTVEREAPLAAQDRKDVIGTTDKYLRQTMETEAGEDNEGVRLALYFARKATSIDDAYDILADKALLKVVQTALGISDKTAGANIDVQAAMIKKRLNIADLQDPKKLDKFLVRFSALYDMQNATTTSSPQSILFGNSGSTGFDQTLVSSFQTLLRSKL
jgi:hypothetical protein